MRLLFFILWVVGAGVLSPGRASAQAALSDTLTVVNWNLEWFADGSTHNPATQVAGTRSIMQNLNADVYALCEIVNADSLYSLAASLPGGFSAVVASFGSFAGSVQDPDWPEAQKLALVYRTGKVRVLGARPFLEADPDAYYSFSSGRYPFFVRTEVRGGDGVWRPLSFIVLHAKAQSDYTSCQRRTWGANIMKDSLDKRFANEPFLILGDFNDDLDVSICSGGGASNYASIVADSLDANHYRSLTLPMSKAGAYSLSGYNSLIDHVVASNEMAAAFIPGSAEWLKTKVTTWVPGYENTISDHYPILTKYRLNAATTGVAPRHSEPSALYIFPNPATTEVFIRGAENFTSVDILSTDGRVVRAVQGAPSPIDVSGLPPGVYFLRALAKNGGIQLARLSVHR